MRLGSLKLSTYAADWTEMPSARRLLCCALVLGALALSGCSVRNDHTAGAQEGDDTATLPTLPPAEERLPGSYDENGCLILSAGEVDCNASAESLDEALAGGGGDGARTVAGFVGPLFVTDLSADALVVLEDTITQGSTDGGWSAVGLVRNETTSPVVDPTVTARLLDGNGAQLAEVSAPVAVAPVRPGEPGPFTIAAPDVDPAAVASVEWSFGDGGGPAPPGTRDFEITTYFVEPAGERDPLDLYLYTERGPGPRPYVLFGSATNRSDVDAPDPGVVAAWLGPDGRLRAIVPSAVGGPEDPVPSLPPGSVADFLITVADPAQAAGLDGEELLLWVASR